jgi:diguanylate cyclase (GGDEF)-like protein
MPLTTTRQQPTGLLSRISILVVEDEAATRLELAGHLSRLAGRVFTAADGSDGLRSFREHRPDMVVTDLVMPEMDGLSMAAIIKSESPDTPVVAVTAHSEKHLLLKVIEVGIDGYLLKPVVPEELAAVLFKNARHILNRKQEEARSLLISYLLDINPHFILSALNGKVDYANKTFLQYVGHEDLAELLAGMPGTMNELHVGGARHALADFSWIGRLRALPGQQHTACFSASGEECAAENTFRVTTRHFAGLDRDVVTFTDITPLERERLKLLRHATTDSLTGVANRYKLGEAIAAEHSRFKRYKMPMCLIMFDIDHFKAVNDTLGHAAGDKALSELAQVVMHNIRDTDQVGRWGGEEFMILAPLTTLDDAFEFSDRLRAIIESTPFTGLERLTCSFGVAELAENEPVDSILERVDAALYKAKNNGRNRVESA